MRCSTVLTGYSDFPHVQQVVRVERTTWQSTASATDQPLFREVSFYLSDLKPETAAARLARSAPAASLPPKSITAASNEYLGRLIRGHWGIERLHWLRDRDSREDESQAHRGAGPQAMASLRNCAIGLLHRRHVPNVAAALRHPQRHPEAVALVLGR